MKRAHVFAVDWLPALDEVASGGGLRSLQAVSALQAGGYDVSVSVPRNSTRVKALQTEDPGRLRPMLFHDHLDQTTLLREVRPDVVLWMWPSLRSTPFPPGPVHVCDLNGLQHFEMANGVPAQVGPARRQLIRRCAGADLVLTGSVEQNGFWSAELAREGIAAPTALAPYALPAALRLPPHPGAPSALRRLQFAGNLYSWNCAAAWLEQVADWCRRQGGIELQVVAGLDPGNATSLAAIKALHRIEARPGVHVMGELTLRAILESYQPGSVALDLYDDTLERRLAVPVRSVNALTHGVPLLTNIHGTFTGALARAGAAVIVADDGPDDHAPGPAGPSPLDAALDHLAGLTPDALGAMSAAAVRFAAAAFDEGLARDALLDGIDRAAHARARSRATWLATRADRADRPHVLVLTEQAPHLRDVRVHIPFGAMHREGRIAGYSVWSRGAIDFSTRPPEPDPAFDALWVQRDLPPDLALAVDGLDRPYLLDIDDNLMVSPAYRDRFSPEQMQGTRALVRGCAVLTISTDRLAGLLQQEAHTLLLDRAMTCRNLAAEQPPEVAPGEPRCLVWSQSDKPALAGDYLEVVRAVRDFCAANGLRLVCIGAPPPPLIAEAGVEVEHVGLLPYQAYLAQLRALAPGILVAPIETNADPATMAFVEGKSDIKMLEALATGLVGVFSDAAAYRDSDLPAPILCRNEYSAWFKGLDRARRLCREGQPRQRLPDNRIAAGLGLQSWCQAVTRARLRHPLRLSELRNAMAMTRSRLQRCLLPPDKFDAEWYLTAYPDVREVVEAGIFTAYEHYATHGFRERRQGHIDDRAQPEADQFWASLMATLSDIRTSAENRGTEMDGIMARRDLRRGRVR